MWNSILDFFKKINILIFPVACILLAVIQSFLQKYLLLAFPANAGYSHYAGFLINLLFDVCLWGLYIKKYNADPFRIILMGVFLVELSTGLLLKKLNSPISNGIVWIGLIGVLFIWINTYLNRKKFLPQENER